MKMLISGMAIAASALAIAVPAAAHHSFAMFDRTKTIVIDGTVKEFQFTNPHSWLEIDTVEAGAAKHWSFEMNNLVGLRRVGWRAKTLQPGDKVKVTMHPMRDGTSAGQLMSVTLPGGQIFDGQGIKPATGVAAPTAN
jgi:hypothetical protein